MPVLHDVWLYIHVNFVIFSYCLIFVAAVSAALYLIRRMLQKFKGQDGKGDYARAGGIASVVEVRPAHKQNATNFGSVLDGATMILVELSFIILWTGIVMGAIWADHSWGRPWGWDPKEVFALNTFLIFVVLIHTRMKVKDKGFWTAWLALIGCAVMLFNWIIINFTISGLHSYA
jgi:ABC-type transport system involved in cytochrome c biogenesis permease subunit